MPAMSAGEAIGTFKDVVLATAAFVGMLVAVSGLNTWNRQLKGAVEYELTRRLLKCTYRLREAIKGVRNPMMLAEEQVVQDGERQLSRAEALHRGTTNAYQARWEKVTTARDDLRTELLEAEVVWNSAIYEKFSPLFTLQDELFVDVHSFLASTNPADSEESLHAWREIRQLRRRVLYDMSGAAPDPYSDEFAIAISEIESYLKPHLAK
jgi:hypothetical protein